MPLLESAQQRRRVCWFVDLEMLVERLEVLGRLRDRIGLTTIVPESHISHTSGFAADPSLAGPLEDWANSPTLAVHRSVFGVAEPAMAVLPGVVGGVSDGPLLRVLQECRRLGLDVWGHAGLWCYGAEVFPQYAAVDLFGRSQLPDALPWGTMFCPNQAELHAWIVASLSDAARRYDLDGWFLDHARYPSPAHPASILLCACPRCAERAASRGIDVNACADDLRGLISDVARDDGAAPEQLLAARPGVRAWLDVRAAVLADRFTEVLDALSTASGRPVHVGSDVFPPSTALLGGHAYDHWTHSATYLTGGFGARIGWGTVAQVTAAGFRAATPAGIDPDAVTRLMEAALGPSATAHPTETASAFRHELRLLAAAQPRVPIYPPIPAGRSAPELRVMTQAIQDFGFDGAMLAGLEDYDEQCLDILAEALPTR